MIADREVRLPLCDDCGRCWAAEWRAGRWLTSPPNDACGRCGACRRGPVVPVISSMTRHGARPTPTGWRAGGASGARDLTVNLYVILLCDAVWMGDRRLNREFRKRNRHYRRRRIRFLRKGCVYVGQTWHRPEVRFCQHRNGKRAGRGIVRKYGVRLVPHLYEQLDPVPEAEREEREERLALDLQRRGYGVWWN